LISAYTVWLIPEEATRDEATAGRLSSLMPSRPLTGATFHNVEAPARDSFVTELREGVKYALTNHFALTILLMNIIWATGGGATNVIYERIGGVYFAETEGWNPDVGVALLWTATGLGLTLGMLLAHRTSTFLDRKNWNHGFIGWTLVVHGILFSTAAFMPGLWPFGVVIFVSRVIVGVEYAVQETMFQRSLPDVIRGRISTLDRGAELTVFGLSSYISSGLMFYMTPHTLTIISGVLSALAGIVWFLRERKTSGRYDDGLGAG
jgi:hypothetical protein